MSLLLRRSSTILPLRAFTTATSPAALVAARSHKRASMTDFVPPSLFASSGEASRDYHSTTQGAAAATTSKTTEIKTHNQYKTAGLDESTLDKSAMGQFNKWFKEALDHPQIPEPESMTISTVAVVQGKPARPSSRVVLLKKVDERGFLFYSNYESRKGQELQANPFIALTFYWYPLHRSVRVCGKVERLTKEENHQYFNSRPVGSRIGAISSPQSQVIQNRKQLEDIVRSNEKKYNAIGSAGLDGGEEPEGSPDQDIPVPDYWGGFRVVPDEIEFWMGRSNRLHDRFRYTRPTDSEADEWTIDRLAP